jgi:hypothetical protein
MTDCSQRAAAPESKIVALCKPLDAVLQPSSCAKQANEYHRVCKSRRQRKRARGRTGAPEPADHGSEEDDQDDEEHHDERRHRRRHRRQRRPVQETLDTSAEENIGGLDLSDRESLGENCRKWIACTLEQLCVDRETGDYKAVAATMHPRDVETSLAYMTQTLELPECMAEVCGLVARVTQGNIWNWVSIVKEGGLALVLQALRRHAKDDNVVEKACAALATQSLHTRLTRLAVATCERSSVLLGKLGGIPLLLTAVQQHASLPRTAAQAARALTTAVWSEGNWPEFIRSDGITVLVKQLALACSAQGLETKHEHGARASETATAPAAHGQGDGGHSDLQEWAEVTKWTCATLASLAKDCQEARRLIVEHAGVAKLFDIVRKYSADRTVLALAARALVGLFADDSLRVPCIEQIRSASAPSEFRHAAGLHCDNEISQSVWQLVFWICKHPKAPTANREPVGWLFGISDSTSNLETASAARLLML